MNTLQNGVYYEKYPRDAHPYNDDVDYAENSYDGELRVSPGHAPEQGYEPQLRYETAHIDGSRRNRSFGRELLRFWRSLAFLPLRSPRNTATPRRLKR
jgi:hypothetical protein